MRKAQHQRILSSTYRELPKSLANLYWIVRLFAPVILACPLRLHFSGLPTYRQAEHPDYPDDVQVADHPEVIARGLEPKCRMRDLIASLLNDGVLLSCRLPYVQARECRLRWCQEGPGYKRIALRGGR